MWTAWLRPMELCSNFLQKEQRMGKGISSCKSGVDLSPNYHPEVSKSRVDLSLVGSAKQRDGARSPRCSAAPRPVAFRERWLWRRRPARDCRARCASASTRRLCRSSHRRPPRDLAGAQRPLSCLVAAPVFRGHRGCAEYFQLVRGCWNHTDYVRLTTARESPGAREARASGGKRGNLARYNGAGAWLEVLLAVRAGEFLAYDLHHLPLPRRHGRDEIVTKLF